MVGTPPELIASRNDCARLANMGPVNTIDPSCFGLALSSMYFVNVSIPVLNSSRKCSICKD